MNQKHRQATYRLILLSGMIFSFFSCQNENRAEGLSVSFENGQVTYSVYYRGESNYTLYSSKTKDGKYEAVEENSKGTYTTSDLSSYYYFESKDGKRKSTPYSYLKSFFGNDNVHVYNENDDPSLIQSDIDLTYNKMEWDEFSTDKQEFLFLPGDYSSIEAKVGYYTVIAGLGKTPKEVKTKTLTRYDSPLASGALCNFWCGAENFSTLQDSHFYVSQATYLRRMNIQGNLYVSDSGYSSGGFLADSKVSGNIQNQTQQQWFSRNDEWDSWAGNVDINMVYSGVKGKTKNTWPNPRTTVIEKTERMEEKPFLTFDSQLGYGVFLPVVKENYQGVTWEEEEEGTFCSLDKFYLAHPENDTSSTLNAALESGKNLLFTPGIYDLDSALEIKNKDTIVMGMGLATLRSSEKNTDSIIKVESNEGVKVCDLLVETGSVLNTIMEVGKKDNTDYSSDPILLADLFFRIGGSLDRKTGASQTLVIDANDVIGDNFWAWRADHGQNHELLEQYMNEDGTLPSDIGEKTGYAFWKGYGVGWKTEEKSNYVKNGVVVNGDRVALYGLMVEHFGEYQTIWNGEDGLMVFYQSETPYDAPTQEEWQKDETTEGQGYASYKVSDDVISHRAYGIGVYYVHNDTDQQIALDHAIEAPANDEIQLIHMAIANFKGNTGCGIRHICNQYGVGNIAPYVSQKTSLTSFIGGKVTL